ncbi:cytochrome P450 [Pseudooceanicola sp. CBS1P-1]|uniref:Cytochrome P450 n=1 Tax=Pseudooceanicola albus TaxID=2692189 RepID=A0A6L7G0N9_9RHOB|nr:MULTISPECIES: cytochrome P450 [Pseudooceanicola]MBT9382465.1 cytochrome P450 [Pseudooceanicola endophyticus]MXN17006.1 cytochrome P450 [Pseudooceanicola albus]
MIQISQSPTDADFVQNPYPFYDRARAQGPLLEWTDYGVPAAFSYALVNALLRDRRFGTKPPEDLEPPRPAHLDGFYRVEDRSMLAQEGAAHKRLRGLVLRAFTSRRINALGPEIETLCHRLIDEFPADQPFDLVSAYATHVPVIVIARLLGVPEDMAPQLLFWSNTMVAMYQARRDTRIEEEADRASAEFYDYIRGYAEERRSRPGDDLITELLNAEEDGEKLTMDELIGTCILLLNAGHEATVNTLGNGVLTLLRHGEAARWLTPETVDGTVEEILRYDPPLHLFSRYALEEAEVGGHLFRRGDRVACLLGSANRDPDTWEEPNRFDPARPVKTNAAFGAGAHFCIGAPLARLELKIALPVLFRRCPNLRLAEEPRYADLYHFHGLKDLMVTV